MTKKNYDSPKKEDSDFTKYWQLMVGDVSERANFKEHHLEQLSVLCDLYVEYNKVSGIIKLEGYTFENDGRHGAQLKTRPEVTIRDKILMEIRSYSKILGLILVKDEAVTNKPERDKSWD